VNSETKEILARVLEPRQWSKSRIRCNGSSDSCGERIYYSTEAEAVLDTVLMHGHTMRTMLIAVHRASGHYVGTAKELEDNNAPIPSV
jgi:aerobic-type carbon monoxide dehydrogenase small subunit (CoxS/CutS family)